MLAEAAPRLKKVARGGNTEEGGRVGRWTIAMSSGMIVRRIDTRVYGKKISCVRSSLTDSLLSHSLLLRVSFRRGRTDLRSIDILLLLPAQKGPFVWP